MTSAGFFSGRVPAIICSFSRSHRENEPKEGRYPQGPLQRGMQHEKSQRPPTFGLWPSSVATRQCRCEHRTALPAPSVLRSGIAGHAIIFLSATAQIRQSPSSQGGVGESVGKDGEPRQGHRLESHTKTLTEVGRPPKSVKPPNIGGGLAGVDVSLLLSLRQRK